MSYVFALDGGTIVLQHVNVEDASVRMCVF